MQPVVLVMPGKPCAASHEWVVTEPNRVGGDISKIRSRTRSCLARHSNRFISSNEDQLRAVYVVRLEEYAVPCGSLRPGRESSTRQVVRRTSCIDWITVPLTEPSAILAMLSDHLKIEVLAEVKLPDKALTAEGFVADASSRDWRAPGRQVVRRSFTDHGVGADTINSQFARVEGLAGRKETRVGVSIRQADVSIVGTEHGRGITGAIVIRVSHHFDAKLVVTHLPEDIAVADG